MLHWKRKPIDQLSERELRQALNEIVPMVMNKKGVSNTSDIFSSFTTGLFVGLAAAALCIVIASSL